MPAKEISIDKAKKDKLFYFVANVLVYRDDGRCLILKRDEREKVHPGKWGTPGGKLEWNDFPLKPDGEVYNDVWQFHRSVEDLCRREAKEEANVDLGDEWVYIDSTVFVRPDGIPVVLIKLGAKYKGGDIVLEEGAFTDYAWVNAEEVKKYDCVINVPEEIEKAIRLFRKQE